MMKWRKNHSNEDGTQSPLSQHEQRTRELISLIKHDDDVLMERGGWMLVSTLVFIHNFPAEEVFDIVATDPKQRFEMSADLTEIRMRRRHRRSKGVGLEVAEPPEKLYHGADSLLIKYILTAGILGYATLYDNKNEALENEDVQWNTPAYFEVDAKRMKEEGGKLYRTREGSWISFFVAPQYITNVIIKGNNGRNLELVNLGKKLSFLLRHDTHYNFDEHGWREVNDLVSNHGFTLEDLYEVVATNNKKRYEFSDDRTLIRACQGHSIPVDLELSETTPPPVLYHGTARHFVESIREQGIQRKCRLYVHLSDDADSAIKVGARHGIPAVLKIDAQRMNEDGVKFFLSRNGIWLTEFVDPKYIIDIR